MELMRHLKSQIEQHTARGALSKLYETPTKEKSPTETVEESITIDLSDRSSDNTIFENPTELTKEKLILEEDGAEEKLSFEEYEDSILKPIKPLDTLLKQINPDQELPSELNGFIEVMKNNATLSLKIVRSIPPKTQPQKFTMAKGSLDLFLQ